MAMRHLGGNLPPATKEWLLGALVVLLVLAVLSLLRDAAGSSVRHPWRHPPG